MNNEDKVLVIAHRGFRGIAPENTLLAARKGYEAGAGWWELDVAASSDGTLVVIHDDNLERTTDAERVFPGREPWTVYDFSLDELKSLDAGALYGLADPFRQIAGGRVGPAEVAGFRGQRIPTLREALELTKSLSWNVNIEIKDATGHACDLWIVEKTVGMVRDLAMQEAVLISSFNHAYLRRSKAAAPEIATAALIDRPIADPVGRLRELGAVALNPNAKFLERSVVEAVRKAGFGILVWTVNEKADMKRLVEWGVTGLISDFPDRAIEVLAGSN